VNAVTTHSRFAVAGYDQVRATPTSLKREYGHSRIHCRRPYHVVVSVTPTIFVLPVPSWSRPKSSKPRYPKYSNGWGIEQDFAEFVEFRYPFRVKDARTADFLYLPIFWTRLQSPGFSRVQVGSRLAAVVDPYLHFGSRLLTLCQHDDGPCVDLGSATVYLGSRQGADGKDAPLLAEPVPGLLRKPKRDVFMSFVGRAETHPIRSELIQAVRADSKVLIETKKVRPRKFASILARSKIVLAPRGYGGSSFRFFEALKYGAVPWLVGEPDTRPFKRVVAWEEYSFYSRNVDEFKEQLQNLSIELVDKKLDSVRAAPPRLDFGAWPMDLLQDLGQGVQRSSGDRS